MNVLNSENFIETIARLYKQAWIENPGSHGARIHQAARDYMFPNGMPLLKIKAMFLLDEAQAYVDNGLLSSEDYKILESKLIQY
jgi:hypothetical protein